MEIVLFAAAFLLMGLRHGFDSDHVAAIADMVGTESTKGSGRTFRLGVMYALGHGMIVFVIGMLAVFAGSHLSDAMLKGLEMLVGVTLLILGAVIILSIFRHKQDYQYVSRVAILYGWIKRLISSKGSHNHKIYEVGIAGAFIIGIIHGLGAETPTQVALLSTVAGIGSLLIAAAQIVLFTAGLLIATLFIAYAVSWGFMKAAMHRKVYLVLGCLTGVYSLVLGTVILMGS